MATRGRAIDNYMTLEYAFSGIRLQDSYLYSINWNMTIDLIVEAKTSKKQNDIESAAGLAFQKIHFWLDTNMPGVIITDVGNEEDMYIANHSSNIVMFCPGSPSDDMLIKLLHSKLSTVAYPHIIVGKIILKGDDNPLHYTFDCRDGRYELPETTEYVGTSTRDILPWWSRSDGFCFELMRPEDTELSDEELFKDIVDPMDEFARYIAENETSTSLMKEPAKIIQIEKWRPKTI